MITIKGIRIETLTITRRNDGGEEIASSYSLISSADKVLAKQSVGGSYSDMKVQTSPATTKAFEDALALYKADVGATLGLEAS